MVRGSSQFWFVSEYWYLYGSGGVTCGWGLIGIGMNSMCYDKNDCINSRKNVYVKTIHGIYRFH